MNVLAGDHWKAENYAKHAHFVAKLTSEVLQDLKPEMGEHILDLGCGDGALAKDLQLRGCRVVGLDNSRELLSIAQRKGIKTILGDAQKMAFNDEFDAVFSNAAMHWMPLQSELASRVYRSLKQGGRFVGEMGGAGNIQTLIQALKEVLPRFGLDFASRNPWTFPTVQQQRDTLEKAGFQVKKCTLRQRPTKLPTDIRGWFLTFGQTWLSDLDPETCEKFFDELVEICHPLLCNSAGEWMVDYVRLNFVALK